MSDTCPECGSPSVADRYAPWCSRGCKARHRRRTTVDPDIIARRVAYMECVELGKLRAELAGAKRVIGQLRYRNAQRESEYARCVERLVILALLEPKIAALVDKEVQLREERGRNARQAGAKDVIETDRKLAQAKRAVETT